MPICSEIDIGYACPMHFGLYIAWMIAYVHTLSKEEFNTYMLSLLFLELFIFAKLLASLLINYTGWYVFILYIHYFLFIRNYCNYVIVVSIGAR
jgi:hypothetical protein